MISQGSWCPALHTSKHLCLSCSASWQLQCHSVCASSSDADGTRTCWLTFVCLFMQGDNDPVDVVEIGGKPCQMGGVYKVKPLGEFAAL